jgi:predicted MFS family arabinose efflux permease
MSLIATADSLGMMIGPILGGVAMDALSREAAFRGGSVLMTAVTVLLVVCFRKAPQSEIGDACQDGRIKLMK